MPAQRQRLDGKQPRLHAQQHRVHDADGMQHKPLNAPVSL
jgi:hypothetical protein